jgi:opacity protein-like surface antigen
MIRAAMRLTLLVLTLVLPSLAAAAPWYVRGGAGFEQSAPATMVDLDCHSTQPPALFGCADASDGRPLAARGDFGGTPSWELGAGMALGRARVDVTVTARPQIDLRADSNFLNVSGRQPVSANGKATTAMLNAALDVAPENWRIRPFLTAGAGVSRNETGAVTFGFPSIAPDAVTVIRGGRSNELAWSAGAGIAFDVAHNLSLDIAWRRTDLGDMTTRAGEATIVRPRGTFVLDIAGTRAPVKLNGVSVSVRWRK